MKYHQILNRMSKNKSTQIIDWALNEAEYFSLVWQKDFQFNKDARQIEESLKKYLVKSELTNEWPGTKVYGPPDTRICFYKVTERTAKIIKKKGSIFAWIAPNLPEDIAFYNKEYEPIFGSVAHEKIAFIIGDNKIIENVKNSISNLKLKII